MNTRNKLPIHFYLSICFLLTTYSLHSQQGPIYDGGQFYYERNYCEDAELWLPTVLSDIELFVSSDCNNGLSLITAEYDCEPYSISCNEMKTIVATFTDECGQSNQYSFDFYTHDGDGIDPAVDNCPNNYNPGKKISIMMALVMFAILLINQTNLFKLKTIFF